MSEVVISVILPTYNRSRMLREAIEGLLAQRDCPVGYELIVVDNNSSDDTRETVLSVGHGAGVPLRYLVESRQGVSYARNAGIDAAHGSIIAFIDDDVRPASNWLLKLYDVFQAFPDVGFVGGRVLPEWETAPPTWLTREHWMPLALLDYGDAHFRVNASNRLCLITANLAVRRPVFDTVGHFAPELQRVRDGIGSMEDHEFLERVFLAGIEGLYLPDLVVSTKVPAARVRRAYHRRWHLGHGHFYALKHSEDFEPASARRLFGVPAYLYKRAAGDLAHLLTAWWRSAPEVTASREMRLCFFGGFARTRYADIVRARGALPLGPYGGTGSGSHV